MKEASCYTIWCLEITELEVEHDLRAGLAMLELFPSLAIGKHGCYKTKRREQWTR